MRKVDWTTFLAIALLICLVVATARACSIAYPRNERVRFADQSVAIVWDSANKVEHFIRKATFESGTKDFGFIVPTPTKPTLAEAKDSAFGAFEKITAQETKAVEWKFMPFLCASISCGKRVKEEKQPGVRVLDTLRVAGFDAAILEADDASNLAAWLADRGYFFRPELASWLHYYVAKQWKVTAFKIAHDPRTGKPVTTSAVRMSFPTERPFFPYRVPDEIDPKRRLLRIFMVSDQRVDAKLGDNSQWTGKTVWANRLSQEQGASLADEIGIDKSALPANAWLTTFDDASFPNPGRDDVYFRAAAAQEVLHRPPLERVIWIPSDLVVILGSVIVLRWLRRKKPASAISSS